MNISNIYKTRLERRWPGMSHMHPAAVRGLAIEISPLAFVIANGGTVSLNAPWGLVTSHPKPSASLRF